MDKRATWWLVALAAGLFLFILFFERKLPDSASLRQPGSLAGIDSNAITGLEITSTNWTNILRAEKIGGRWVLSNPAYPAEESIVEAFAGVVAGLKKHDQIGAHEVLVEGQKSFGLATPRARITVMSQTNQATFEVGALTPLSSNVYVRALPSGDVYITDGILDKALPRSPDQWRSRDLAEWNELRFDHLQIRSGQRVFEIELNPTNSNWQISKPVPARADQDRIASLFRRLSATQVRQFEGNPAELERFGLQTPELEMLFLQGTNQVYSIEFGASPANATNRVYARLLGKTNVVQIDRELAESLKQPYNTFHDPKLVSFNPKTLDRIVVQSIENFTLQRQTDGGWTVDRNPRAVMDPELMSLFLTNLLDLEIINIAREIPTEEDLKAFGLATPTAVYALADKLTNGSGIPTNILATEIYFGTNAPGRFDVIYCKRSDERPVYLTMTAGMLELPRRLFQLKDRAIWNFASTNATAITLRNGISTNTATRGPNGWASDPIRSAAIDEAVYRLSRLRALQWVAKTSRNLDRFGIGPDSVTLEIRLDGLTSEPIPVQFGKPMISRNVYGAILFPGDEETTIFEFPGGLYQQLLTYLPLKQEL